MIIYLANNNRSTDFFGTFQLIVNDILKSGAIDIVYMMYKVSFIVRLLLDNVYSIERILVFDVSNKSLLIY